MKAIEINTKTDESGRLKVDIPLKKENQEVRLLILLNEDDETDEDEQQWLYSISKSPSFDFLNEPEEDIYSLNDGEPVNDEK